MEKELEKELNAVQKVQDSIPKSPVKYEKKNSMRLQRQLIK